MIRLYLIGGLGNQMFEYAFARAISEKIKEPIEINPECFLFFDLIRKRKEKTINYLNHFNLNKNVKIVSNKIKGFEYFLRYAYDYFSQPASKEIFEKRARKGKLIETTKNACNYHTIPKLPNKINIIGYYADDRYFAEIEPIIQDEFQVITPPSPQNMQMIEEISSCNSVCVHVRRGDYLLKENAFLNVVDEKYFQNAMKYIYEHTENPVFYIFSNNSDDIQWIKENYHFDYPVKYVDLNNPNYEELRLMYHCKHFIISQSSFSWWGSYLSKNKDKILIAPKKSESEFLRKMIKL